ncbi:MAG: putative selenium-dependent hydroxylase accessory protein YqeC [Oscillospiraceae bacterium]|nr:putative selenium-dependent hydroxylase accessory protein YqeC [Oscillospiraceae bacterium]
MIIAVVGSGGKTTLIKKLASRYRREGKTVLVTTTTHMFLEEDTLLTDDADTIIPALKEKGCIMAGVPDGKKIKALSKETFDEACLHADVVLVEADGSKCLPLKYPNATEPVIPNNTDEIIVVCGLNAIGQKAQDVCHRLELVKECLGIDDNTVITPAHIQKLVTEGYLKPLRAVYPKAKISVRPRHDGSLYQRAIASLLQNEQNVSILRKEWFCPQPKLILCGGGHVSREVAAFAHRLDFSVTVMDERPEAVTRERFPTAEALICDSYENLKQYLEPDACYVVVTPEHKADLQCVSTILPTQYRYLGMIGSRKKVASTVENLRNAGFTQAQIDSIFAPIGLSIGAVTPAEIALSILAQIIQVKNKTHAASADKVLLEEKEPGVLCIITEKHGSTPRGVGSMMFVGEEKVLGSIGGGEPEYLAICHAREDPGFDLREYTLNNTAPNGLDMICGGRIKVLFIPV